jgi:hypothetical protein
MRCGQCGEEIGRRPFHSCSGYDAVGKRMKALVEPKRVEVGGADMELDLEAGILTIKPSKWTGELALPMRFVTEKKLVEKT